MDSQRKQNIIFLAGVDTPECIEIQRDSENVEVVIVDKEVKLLEECLVDLYKQIQVLTQRIKLLELKTQSSSSIT